MEAVKHRELIAKGIPVEAGSHVGAIGSFGISASWDRLLQAYEKARQAAVAAEEAAQAAREAAEKAGSLLRVCASLASRVCACQPGLAFAAVGAMRRNSWERVKMKMARRRRRLRGKESSAKRSSEARAWFRLKERPKRRRQKAKPRSQRPRRFPLASLTSTLCGGRGREEGRRVRVIRATAECSFKASLPLACRVPNPGSPLKG